MSTTKETGKVGNKHLDLKSTHTYISHDKIMFDPILIKKKKLEIRI